ncbi:hypothetical protein K493DRAFT_295030 [Basidiobolus meristosporus CBS 931.73]|uniref:Uncharacterized protein n=1 Tax=Basidiobolus meristosporus CBS 931.73 TaxID=1314790 RepID=A0A1Y1ZDW9_9FUNG|nr:hypothetical protein K493DRAFT_295030 [Basidiobolus meristosporus CBS 931.73]|eukprot:ORY08441.1 hypothetical protein K493DRAFT_295030 [Basidiobolus meristosporus CBS 931.73]
MDKRSSEAENTVTVDLTQRRRQRRTNRRQRPEERGEDQADNSWEVNEEVVKVTPKQCWSNPVVEALAMVQTELPEYSSTSHHKILQITPSTSSQAERPSTTNEDEEQRVTCVSWNHTHQLLHVKGHNYSPTYRNTSFRYINATIAATTTTAINNILKKSDK